MDRHAIPGRTSPTRYLALVLIIVAIATAGISDTEFGQAIGGGVLALGHLTAGVVMFRHSKSLPDSERRPWRLIAGALFVAVLGLLVVASQGAEAPVVGPADVFFVGTYVVLLLALAQIAGADHDGPPWYMTLLDVAIGGVATGAIVWEFLLRDLGGLDSSIRWLAAYPVADVAILVGLLAVALRRSHYRFDPRLLLIGAGLILQVVADLSYLREVADLAAMAEGVGSATFAEASPLLPLWLVSSALFVLTAGIVDRRPAQQEFPDAETPLWASMAPYIIAGALVPIHVGKVAGLGETGERVGTDELVVMYALLVVGVLVVIRQAISIRDNRIRVEQQRLDLISSVSHELRTPLTAIMGFLTVLEDDAASYSQEERSELMAEVTTQAQHMSRTMTDLITLARDGGVDLAVRPRATSLSAVVHAAVDEIGLTDAVDVTSPDSIVTLDPDRLRQAIAHLVSNARRYGGPTIEVTAGVTTTAVSIQVHDDGPGIPTRHLNTIWNQLERGPRRLDASKPGLGMGLPIVRAIALAHGGTARYERSQRLGGACFTIVIPNAPADFATQLIPESAH